MQYYSLDEVVAEAMLIVKDKDKYQLPARQWVYSALIYHGSADDEIDVCEITVKNLLAKKPDACRQILELACYNSAGELLPHTFRGGKKRIYPNQNAIATVINEDGETVTYWESVDVSEDRFNIILGTNGTDVAKIKLRFYSYPLDNQGQPLIRDDEKQSCIYFVRFQIALLQDDNQSKIQLDEQRWKLEADRVRAGKKVSSMNGEKRKAISRNWMKLLPNFNHSQF